jgi:chromosome segregation ATPase
MSDTPMPETLESLATKITALTEVVKAGFTDFAGRFNQVEERFDKVDERLDTVDGRLNKVEERFDKVDGRLDRVEGKFDKVDGRFNIIDGRLDKTDDRFTSLEASIDRKLDEMRSQLGVKIEAVDARVVQVYDAVIALTSHEKQNRKDHKRFDEKLEEHDVRLLALEHPARRNRRKAER